MRYRDLDSAVTFLCAAFGFRAEQVTRGADEQIVSAQLVSGNGMVMLLTVGDSQFDTFMKQPDEIGGSETQSCYFVVDDSDAHYATAIANGADIVLPLQSFEHGGRGYLCRDIEGHLWSFGTYDPWGVVRTQPVSLSHVDKLVGAARQRPAIVAAGGAALLLLAAATALWPGGDGSNVEAASSVAAISKADRERDAAVQRAAAAESELAGLRNEKDASEADRDKLQEQLEHLSQARDGHEAEKRSDKTTINRLQSEIAALSATAAAADKSMQASRARLTYERRSAERSRRRAAELADQLLGGRADQQRMERGRKDLQAKLDQELAAQQQASAGRARAEALLKQEQAARRELEIKLQQTAEQLTREREARRASEMAQQEAPAGSPVGPLSPPRPAKRPEKGGSQPGAASESER